MPQRKKNTSIIASLTAIKLDVATIKKNYVTKNDLERFATKDELNEAVAGLASKKDVADIMWELKNIREENTVLADMKRQVNEHEDRLETVETKLGIAL